MRLRNLYQSYSVYYTGKIPVFCGDTEAWLGHGHYFWDSFVDDAHWWGHTHYHGDYSICQSSYDYDSLDFFDLVGNTEHIAAFEKCARILQKRYTGGRQLKVYDVLGFMKVVNKSFRFKAYRAWPIPDRRVRGEKFFAELLRDESPIGFALKQIGDDNRQVIGVGAVDDVCDGGNRFDVNFGRGEASIIRSVERMNMFAEGKKFRLAHGAAHVDEQIGQREVNVARRQGREAFHGNRRVEVNVAVDFFWRG